jgi:hypothetical protein
MTTVTHEEMLATLRCVLKFIPGPFRLTLTSESNQFKATWIVLGQAAQASGLPEGRASLSEMESDILQALGDDTLTGEQIAARTVYPFESNFRACLAALRRRGILGGEKGQPGYFVTALGQPLVDGGPAAS